MLYFVSKSIPIPQYHVKLLQKLKIVNLSKFKNVQT